MEYKTYIEGIAMIQKVLDKKYTDDQTDYYWVLLKDIPEENFMLGINILLRERDSPFLPTPADIRTFCTATRDTDLEIRIARAKLLVKNALNSVGTYESVAFDDPIIHLIIRDAGGWIKLGKMTLKEYEDYLKWDFPRLYKAYAANKTSDIPLFLEGISKNPKIHCIGEQEKTMKWIESYQKKHPEGKIASTDRMTIMLEDLKKGKVI